MKLDGNTASLSTDKHTECLFGVIAYSHPFEFILVVSWRVQCANLIHPIYSVWLDLVVGIIIANQVMIAV